MYRENKVMSQPYFFPFGMPVRAVEQKDRSPKKAFVLGVYASAVHARWVGADGKQKVTALAVASEPEIFWRGDNAAEIISSIQIPAELGRLEVPKNTSFNGPSGMALDHHFLAPLGLSRKDVWLCDLLPESRVNPAQRAAIEKHYNSVADQYGLPPATVPDFDDSLVRSQARRNQILEELHQSQADTIILLGDYPVKYFLKEVSNCKRSKLSEFEPYGVPVQVSIQSKIYSVIALCHPRQAARLGMSSQSWYEKHARWSAQNLAQNV